MLGLVGVLVVISVYDIRHMEIPVPALSFGIAWTSVSLSLLFVFDDPAGSFFSSRLWEGLVGGALAFFLFYSLVFFSKETWMGEGDAWLALLLGLVTGWKLLLPALTIASGAGSVVGIAIMLFGTKGRGSRIPFGPFLAASVLFTAFFGTIIGEVFGLSVM
jgi:prepilin signal peptidase PulO-like enzyme (type II secretory pathway)